VRKELPINQKIYDLMVWLTNHLDHFPRARRHTLGKRIEDILYDLLEKCIEARFSSDKAIKADCLRQANIKLEQLRCFIRLAYQQKLLSGKQYQFVSVNINDIGIALGGWFKEVNRR